MKFYSVLVDCWLNKRDDSGLKREKCTYEEEKRERERKRNAAGAAAIYYIYLMLQYRISATLAEAASLPMLPWVPKNPADRNSKGEAMRNEPSESVRVVTRCALLCLGSRAISLSPSPGHSRALISDAERDENGEERVRELLENDQPSGQRALGAASRYYLKEVLYTYIYMCVCVYVYSYIWYV